MSNVTSIEDVKAKLGEVLDADTVEEFSVFLSERDTPPLTERTTHSGSYMVDFGDNKYLDQYNPSDIQISTFDKMRDDPQISLGLSIIKLPILALSFNVKCTDHKVAAFIKASLEPIWRPLMKSTLTSLDFGFASHEKVWEYQKKYLVQTIEKGVEKTHFNGPAYIYKKIKSHHPSSISVRIDKVGNFRGISQSQGVGEEAVRLPASKCYIHTNDLEFGNHYGRSRLRSAYNSWYWKMIVYQFMLRYLERRGTPPIIVTAPSGEKIIKAAPGSGLPDRRINNLDSALALGKSLLTNAVGVVPYSESKAGNSQWSVEYLKDDQRAVQFLEVINHLDAKCLRSLLIPERTVTQDSSVGSNAMAATHSSVFLTAMEGTVSEIESSLNKYLVPQLVRYNFGKNAPKATIQLDKLRWDKKQHFKEIFQVMIQNIEKFIEDPKGAEKGLNVIPDFQKMAEILEVPTRTAKLIPDFYQRQEGGQGRPADASAKSRANEKNKKKQKTENRISVVSIAKKNTRKTKLSTEDLDNYDLGEAMFTKPYPGMHIHHKTLNIYENEFMQKARRACTGHLHYLVNEKKMIPRGEEIYLLAYDALEQSYRLGSEGNDPDDGVIEDGASALNQEYLDLVEAGFKKVMSGVTEETEEDDVNFALGEMVESIYSINLRALIKVSIVEAFLAGRAGQEVTDA